VLQIGFPTSMNFPRFSSIAIYFSRTENGYLGFIKTEFSLTCGARLSLARSPRAATWMAVVGGSLLLPCVQKRGCCLKPRSSVRRVPSRLVRSAWPARRLCPVSPSASSQSPSTPGRCSSPCRSSSRSRL
jgi:hypothetical protein